MDYISVKNRLEEIFGTVSAIPVRGDSVDIMADVRFKLKALYNELSAAERDEAAEPEKEAE